MTELRLRNSANSVFDSFIHDKITSLVLGPATPGAIQGLFLVRCSGFIPGNAQGSGAVPGIKLGVVECTASA